MDFGGKERGEGKRDKVQLAEAGRDYSPLICYALGKSAVIHVTNKEKKLTAVML